MILKFVLLMTITITSSIAGELIMNEEFNRSYAYANKIETLSTKNLPEGWFDFSDSVSPLERFLHLAMQELGSNNPNDTEVIQRVNSLIAEYNDKDKPFKHVIYFNRPMSIDDNEAAYTLYVISTVKNIMVVVKGLHHKKVLSKQKNYSDEQLLAFEQLL